MHSYEPFQVRENLRWNQVAGISSALGLFTEQKWAGTFPTLRLLCSVAWLVKLLFWKLFCSNWLLSLFLKYNICNMLSIFYLLLGITCVWVRQETEGQQQIRLMGEICTSQQHVVVWTGERPSLLIHYLSLRKLCGLDKGLGKSCSPNHQLL